MSELAGKTILQYEVLEHVGQGGMGVVYKARDSKLDRFVALKFLPPHMNATDQDKARFMQEAKAAAALNHPNVCSIIDIQEYDGSMFIVMEFIDGQTLRAKMGKDHETSVSLKQAIEIGIMVAEGLTAAHEKGIVHRDIKPENIMVRKDGIAQIMDFGLAKLRMSQGSRLTKQGSTIGTAGYMSPEQVQGQETDHRSDIFSLGVLLYELFAGRLPFQGAHETAMMYEIVNVDPPPPSVVRPGLDPELDRIVLECLQKEPDERYNAVKDVAKDLKRCKRESGRQNLSRVTNAHRIERKSEAANDTRAHAPAMRSKVAYAGIGALIALIFLSSFWYLRLRSESPQKNVVRFTVNAPPGQLFGSMCAVAPDGNTFAYVMYSDNHDRIFIRSLSALEAHAVAGSDGAGSLFASSGFVVFSPDGGWLAFSAEGKLKKVSLRGGSSTTLATADALRGISWGDNNTIIYAPKTTGPIWRVPAEGGASEAVSLLDSAAGEISHRYPEILPGSKAFLYTVKTNSITRFSEAKIAVQKFNSKEKTIIIEGGSFARYIPPGYILYGQGGSVYAVPFDAERLAVTGPSTKVLDGGMFAESFGTMTLDVSESGTLVYAPGGPTPLDSNRILDYDRKGNARPLIETPGGYASVSVSPDGERITYYQQAANDDIWIYDIQRHLQTRFTFAGGNNWYPLWAPDGKHIVYTAERGSAPNLFWKSTDGSGVEERLASSVSTQFATSWSSDGKMLAFHQPNSAGNSDIWILPLDGERKPIPFLQTKFDESFASFSPDGHWMAFTSDESGQREVYVVPFPKGEGKWQISTTGGTYPKWTKHGAEIIYFDLSSLSFVSVPLSYAAGFRPGKGVKLFNVPDGPLFLPDISADGEHIRVPLRGQKARITSLVVVANWFEELKKEIGATE